jgi:hypothetical protein
MDLISARERAGVVDEVRNALQAELQSRLQLAGIEIRGAPVGSGSTLTPTTA